MRTIPIKPNPLFDVAEDDIYDKDSTEEKKSMVSFDNSNIDPETTLNKSKVSKAKNGSLLEF